MKNQWDKTYESLVFFKDALEEYFAALPQTNALRKTQNNVLKLWTDALKNLREFDNFVSPISPVEILFPDKNEKFINTWNFWKEYLSEQHGIVMRSRFEKKALERLWEIADKDTTKAIETLNYAMSLGYRNYFKVEPNQKLSKPKDDANPFN